ncbi:MAG: phage major capsid protein [Phascolarctobacterium sp.]|nr:phage major capsid protein [Candidatus Phascolarctobacterium caballi]
MATQVINRTDLGGLIPEPVTREIIQGAVEKSAVLSMGRRLPNMTSKTQTLNVLDALPMAYFVDGDTGFKQTSKMAWDKKKIHAEEIAVIIPIPEAVLDDADYDIWGEIRPRIVEAFGKKIDAAILFGDDKPSTWRDDVLTTATTAGSVVTATTDMYKDIFGEGGVFAKVEESGYDVNGIMAGVSTKAKLRGLVDTTGRPLFTADLHTANNYTLDGTAMTFPMNGAFDQSKALMIAGDFSQLTYAIRQDITYKLLTEATIVDPSTHEIVYSLAQQDMVALRAVMRLGWEIPNPINAFNADMEHPCPFAVYKPQASAV